MKINIYRISDLDALLRSGLYRKDGCVPVTPERVSSYARNPRAEDHMPVLFTMESQDQLVAFRSLLPDYFFSGNEKISFAWLSGNYVVPAYRRKGISLKLFREAESAWNGRLMYTNYSPAARAVYDKSGSFSAFATRKGARYYMRSSLCTLFKNRIKFTSPLRAVDSVVNGFHDAFIANMKFDIPDGTEYSEVESLDASTEKIIGQTNDLSLFRRNQKEFYWIKEHPWVTGDPGISMKGNYPFTHIVERFENRWFKIQHKNATAFLWIKVLNERVSVPYFFYDDPILLVAARQLLLNEMISNKSAYLTIRHPDLGPVMGTRKNPFLLTRSMPQHYFAHHSLRESLPEGQLIHDGDGDCVFT
ncbi:MAG: GNAT family N-acetyltransferase [Bacteroidales bacterium]|nr:GNAT family N-acetyltransferase [Bacteroidales bacterium]